MMAFRGIGGLHTTERVWDGSHDGTGVSGISEPLDLSLACTHPLKKERVALDWVSLGERDPQCAHRAAVVKKWFTRCHHLGWSLPHEIRCCRPATPLSPSMP